MPLVRSRPADAEKEVDTVGSSALRSKYGAGVGCGCGAGFAPTSGKESAAATPAAANTDDERIALFF